MLRSCEGNSPNLQRRFAAHRRALAANFFAGTARNHRGNLAACLQSEKIFARPVLFSGLGSLALSNLEINMIDQHWLTTIRNILKTHQGTPQSVILFLSGNLPGKAQLHLKQLSIFSMITRLPSDPLHKRAKHVLTSGFSSCKSWFFQVRDICVLYNLPHPLQLLSNPIPKDQFRKLTRARVIDYWETRLRQGAALLPSITYFKPQFHSLSTPHPLLWTPGPNSHEVTKSLVQLRMLSGRYRVAKLTRHWSPTNRSGCCPAPLCPDLETLEHLLIDCSYYHQLRARLKMAWYTEHPIPSYI